MYLHVTSEIDFHQRQDKMAETSEILRAELILNRGKMQESIQSNLSTTSACSAGESVGFDNISSCYICHMDLQEPKLLPCLHTFCKKCMQTLASESGEVMTIVCPECYEATLISANIDALPDNTLVQHLHSLLLQSKQSSQKHEFLEMNVCSSCESGKLAVCRCVECIGFLCELCVDSHKSINALRNHSFMPIKEWHNTRQNIDMKPLIAKFCTKHKGEEICNFCVTCRKPSCKDCVDLEHFGPTHKCMPFEDAVMQFKRRIENALENSHQAETKYHGAWKILDKRNAKLNETVCNLTKQIQDVMIREREEIERRERSFITDLEAVSKDKKREMNTYLESVEASLDKFCVAHDFAESVLDLGNNYHFISLVNILCDRLDILATWQPSLPPEDLAEIDFVEEDDDSISENVEDVIDDNVEYVPVWEVERSIGGRGAGAGQFDWCKGVAISLDGHTVIADWGNHRVQVFNKDGAFRCVLNSSKGLQGRLSMPQDVACLLDGRILAIDKSKYVRLYDTDGKYLARFKTIVEDNNNRGNEVELKCITVDRRSRIFVGDVKRNVVTLHYSDGLLVKTIPTVGPSHITITSHDLLVVSCTQKQKVRVMDFEGTFYFQMDVYGDGEKLRPRGVGCDEYDNIYVVHKERGGEKSVHMYDAKGKYVACVAINLNEPYDVDVSPDGRVVVTDDDTVKFFHKL